MRDSGQHQHRNGAPDAEKNELKPWLKECWCIPPQGSAEFVCAMEDVLEVTIANTGTTRSWCAWTRPANSR